MHTTPLQIGEFRRQLLKATRIRAARDLEIEEEYSTLGHRIGSEAALRDLIDLLRACSSYEAKAILCRRTLDSRC